MRKTLDFLEKYASYIILTCIRMMGYFCLFINGVCYANALNYGVTGWRVFVLIESIIMFIFCRIIVNTMDENRRKKKRERRNRE